MDKIARRKEMKQRTITWKKNTEIGTTRKQKMHIMKTSTPRNKHLWSIRTVWILVRSIVVVKVGEHDLVFGCGCAFS